MTSAYNIWAFGSEGERRAYVVEQDIRFQHAMRKELHSLAADRGLRIVKPSPPKPPQKPEHARDVIVIPHTVPSDVPMTDSQRIMKEVCAKHQVTKAEITGRQRSKQIVLARQELFYRLKKETTLSLPQIGRKVGGRDHSTVLYGVRCHEERMKGLSYSKNRPCYEAMKAERKALEAMEE